MSLVMLATALPASAQWTRVTQLPASNVFSVGAEIDTLLAAADSSVFLSTDAGASWRRSSKLPAPVRFVTTAILHRGHLYAGTAGQGVFVSDDLGVSWRTFNEGLVGGFLDTQRDLSSLAVRGDSLYAGTFGAGVYVRKLAAGGTWGHFGEVFEPNQASNVNGLAVGGSRLLAAAGGNGSVFHRDPGQPEWVISWLDNVGLSPGIQAQSVAFTGQGWVASTLAGVFHSVAGQEPWTRVDLGIGIIRNGAFASNGARLFGAFSVVNGALIEQSSDDGASWQIMDAQPGVFVFSMVAIGDDLFAGRTDGLWRRTNASLAVEGPPANDLRLRPIGRQPAGEDLRFAVELPEAGSYSLEVFDVLGRRAVAPVRATASAGTREVTLDARALPPGVYEVLLTAGARRAVARVVHAR